ncbi:MAG: hypothetical protein HXY40_13580 [Chloroflexi bacterium]|nr:hypothetical protein [Chloroflexota bacterium]
MTDTSPVVLAMCGLALVCLGVLGVGAFVLIRATGAAFLGPLLDVFGGRSPLAGDHEDDDLPRRASQRPASPGQSFQAKAQSLDFDSAVQKYRQQNPSSGQTTAYGAQSAPPPSAPFRQDNAPFGASAPANPPPPPSNAPPPPSLGPLSKPPPALRSRPTRRGDVDHDVDDDMLG